MEFGLANETLENSYIQSFKSNSTENVYCNIHFVVALHTHTYTHTHTHDRS